MILTCSSDHGEVRVRCIFVHRSQQQVVTKKMHCAALNATRVGKNGSTSLGVVQRHAARKLTRPRNFQVRTLTDLRRPFTLDPKRSMSSTSLDPATAMHFLRGGTPNDPAPPPFNLAERGEDSLHTLVLLRHGESEWNAENRYTGWHDVNLAKQGKIEAVEAGRFLEDNGIELDQTFTSLLRRATNSADIVLNTARQHWVPITKTWRLNERHYGALTGHKKDTAWKELNLDQELVVQMRRSYDIRPPRMDDDHTYWHGSDRRYEHVRLAVTI